HPLPSWTMMTQQPSSPISLWRTRRVETRSWILFVVCVRQAALLDISVDYRSTSKQVASTLHYCLFDQPSARSNNDHRPSRCGSISGDRVVACGPPCLQNHRPITAPAWLF